MCPDSDYIRYEPQVYGLCGLQNLGNTCFMNSAIQCLSNVPQLTDFFLSDAYLRVLHKRENIPEKRCKLVRAYAELIKVMWSGRATFLRPTKLKLIIGGFAPRFNGYAQQDAQELTSFLLDGLHKELAPPKPRADRSIKERDTRKVSHTEDSQNDTEEGFETADSGHSSEGEETPKQRGAKTNNEDYEEIKEIKEDEIGEETDSANVSETRILNLLEEEMMEEDGDNEEKENQSIVSLLFDGELVSTVRCLTCQNISYTKESFQDISLSIPTLEQLECLMREDSASEFNKKHVDQSQLPVTSSNGYIYWFYELTKDYVVSPWLSWLQSFYKYMFTGSVTLESCLKVFFSADHLHGEDMYSCEKCQKLRNGVKQCALTKLPEVLCIHLKRFRHDTAYNTKVSTRVTFPLCDLDMRPFLDDLVLQENDQISTQYDLIGVISHRGSAADYGHYVAYCKNKCDDNWYEFDDTVVTRVSTLEVMNCEAYVLFYEKVHDF